MYMRNSFTQVRRQINNTHSHTTHTQCAIETLVNMHACYTVIIFIVYILHLYILMISFLQFMELSSLAFYKIILVQLEYGSDQSQHHKCTQRDSQMHTERLTNAQRETHKCTKRDSQMYNERLTNAQRETHKCTTRDSQMHSNAPVNKLRFVCLSITLRLFVFF